MNGSSAYRTLCLLQVDTGAPDADVARKYGISLKTMYAWRTKYGGLSASELTRLKQLEEENRKLKQMVAELSLDEQMLQDVFRKNSEARGAA